MKRAWCFMSSSPRGASRSTMGASGRSIVAAPPPEPISNDLKSGPSSSQFARRRTGTTGAVGAEKSGARKGLASWRARTDAGITWFSASSGFASGSRVMISSSSESSAPDSRSQSRRKRCATVEMEASGSRSVMRLVSRAAVFARICAMPSRRLSSSARSAGPSSGSPLTRARSSRMSSAMTWNFVRLVGPSLFFWAFCSTSRTLRARIGMMGASSSRERVRCRCLVWANGPPVSGPHPNHARTACTAVGTGRTDRSGCRRCRCAESGLRDICMGRAGRGNDPPPSARRTDSSGARQF
jgi:hypothetical protein